LLGDEPSDFRDSSQGPTLKSSLDLSSESQGEPSDCETGLVLEDCPCSGEGDTGQFWDQSLAVSEWLPKGHTLPEVAQVLVANVYWNVRKLKPAALKDMANMFGVAHPPNSHIPWNLQVVAGLLGISPWRVQSCIEDLKKNRWRPRPVREVAPKAPRVPKTTGRSKELDKKTLRTLTRAALAVRSSHGSSNDFLRHICRLEAEGVQVGQKLHTRHFYKDVEFLGARCLQRYDAEDISRRLPGLGIPTDFAILMDGVPLGGINLHGRHGWFRRVLGRCRRTGRIDLHVSRPAGPPPPPQRPQNPPVGCQSRLHRPDDIGLDSHTCLEFCSLRWFLGFSVAVDVLPQTDGVHPQPNAASCAPTNLAAKHVGF
jgi:hypothetical protein